MLAVLFTKCNIELMTINDVCQTAKMLQKLMKEGFGNIVYKNTKYRFSVTCSNHQHNNNY